MQGVLGFIVLLALMFGVTFVMFNSDGYQAAVVEYNQTQRVVAAERTERQAIRSATLARNFEVGSIVIVGLGIVGGIIGGLTLAVNQHLKRNHELLLEAMKKNNQQSIQKDIQPITVDVLQQLQMSPYFTVVEYTPNCYLITNIDNVQKYVTTHPQLL